MKSKAIAIIFAGLIAYTPASAAEEPFGMGFDGWRFTQQDGPNGVINCRAIQGLHLMSISTDGKTYVSTSSDGLPKGKDEEANIKIGGRNELVQTISGGQGGRLVFGNVDPQMLDQIVKARGYTWTTGLGGRQYSGAVGFNSSTVQAYQRLKECVKRNGGAAKPAPTTSVSSAGINWIEGRAGAPIDRRAVAVGTMPDGLPVFACVAKVNGGLHPGMTGIWIQGCSTGFGGKEITSKSYSLMTGTARWVRASNGLVPPQALQAGNEANGAALFLCRASYNGGMFAGKVRPGFKGCNIVDLGAERTVNAYEVLTP